MIVTQRSRKIGQQYVQNCTLGWTDGAGGGKENGNADDQRETSTESRDVVPEPRYEEDPAARDDRELINSTHG